VIWEPLKLSLFVVSVAIVIVATVGIFLGFILAKYRFHGRELLSALLLLPLVLPPTVTGFYLIVLLGRHGLVGSYIYDWTGWTVTFTPEAAIVTAVVVSLPLMVLSARAAIEGVNPQFEIASYTLGKSRLVTFFRITLPLARRGIIAGIILSLTRALGEFGATFMLAGNIPGRTQTMPLAIYEAVISGEDRRAQLLALILTGLSVTAVYITTTLTKGATAYQ
jgi:molybdate transport system permease protein